MFSTSAIFICESHTHISRYHHSNFYFDINIFCGKVFAISRPIQCLLNNAILVNKYLFLLYVVSIATIDGYCGNHYIY